jgi:tetratricopeptide (TPR) repeat protein
VGIVNKFVGWLFGIWFLVAGANLLFGTGWTGHLGGAAGLIALGVVAVGWTRLAGRLATPKVERAWSKVDSQAFNLHKAGNLAAAEPLYIQAREMAEASGRPLLIAMGLNNIAGLYLDQQRWADAEPLLRQALELREANLGPDDPMTVASVERLSGFLALRERWAEAEQLQRQALASYKRADAHEMVVQTLDAIGVACRHQGNDYAAESSYAEAQKLIDAHKLQTSAVAAQVLGDWAYLKVEQGRLAEAEPMYKNALEILEKSGESTTTVRDNLADLYTKAGRPEDAANVSSINLVAVEKQFQSKFGRSDHGALSLLLEQHATRLEAAGRTAEAQAARDRAASLRQLHPDEAHKADELAADSSAQASAEGSTAVQGDV